MEEYLKDKKILFIGTGFYDYDEKIIQKLEEFGGTVDYFLGKPNYGFLFFSFLSFINKSLGKRSKELFAQIYQFFILRKISNNYAIIFVIKGEVLTEKFMQHLKIKNENAKFIMYQWDSIKNYPNVLNLLKFFDKIYSFDRNDCIKYQNIVKFRPLFFRDESKVVDSKSRCDIDLIFIGELHSDRYNVIKEIKQICDLYSIKCFFYIYHDFLNFFINKYIKRINTHYCYKDLKVKKMSYNNVLDLISRSRVLLDIEHVGQTGLTMRTIEALGAKKKIITTNTDIINYDFYDKNNILVIDRNDVKFDNLFFKSEFKEIQKAVYNRYTLDFWIKEIFEI